MIIWVDDIREPAARTDQVIWCKSVDEAKAAITKYIMTGIDYIDIDHDAGDMYEYGGDFIRLLDWLEFVGFNLPIRIHSMNPVGRENMRRICERNKWEVLK